MRGGGRVSPVLIGREDLLALSDRRTGEVLSGRPHVLLLAGEAGIGKTRLLAEISRRAVRDGFVVVEAAAFPRDAEVAGGVLAELARTLRGSTDPIAVDAGTRMARLLRGDAAPDGGDAHRRRRLLVSDLVDSTLALAKASPVVLALEDLHWADDLTLEVLDRLAHHRADLRMLTIGTYRSDELYPKVPMRAWRTRLLTQRVAEEVRLSRLDGRQTSALANAIAGTVLPADLARLVHARSDGIPLHVEELLAAVAGDAAHDPGLVVPDTLADAILAQTRALSPPALALARAASVIGRSFDIDLLGSVTQEPGPATDESLRELDDRYLIQPRGDGTTYDFRHALIRDAIYGDLRPHERRDLHAKVAAAAASAGLRDAFVSDQYERAHQPALAYRHALAAATEAVSMSAHREAVELYRRAQRTTPRDAPDSERAELLASLAAELAAIDDNAAAETAYQQAQAFRHRLGQPAEAAALMPALVGVRHLLGADLDRRAGLLHTALMWTDEGADAAVRGRLYAALAAAYMLDRRLDEAIEYGEKARAIGDRRERLNLDTTLGSVLVFVGRMEPGWEMLQTAIRDAVAARAEAEAARGYRMIGSSGSVLVEYDRARRWLTEGITYAERSERWNDRHYMNAHLAHVMWATGDWAGAEREARQALADGRGGVTTRITALHVLGYLAMGRAEWTAAREQLHEARDLGEQMRELQRVSPALWGLAEAALRSGHPDEAVQWCERGFAESAAVRDAAYLFPYVVTGTRAYLDLGDTGAARKWIERTEEFLVLRGIPGTMPARDHALGLLYLAEGHTGTARDALARAQEGWDARRRWWEGTQVLLDQARCAVRSRRPSHAAAWATQARERAESIGALTLLAEAGAMLASNRSAPSSDVLTAREIEVATLVATGATNRDIAQSLHIAPKTVAAHIEHILTKLGASRRAEIAAWVSARRRPEA
jgi:DNA-binding CsgD family transcriptional regulator